MNFFINQNSEEPSLKLRLIDDAIYDKKKFNDMMVDAIITLDVFDSQGNPILLDSPCTVVTSYTKFNKDNYDYSIIHKFNKRTTKNTGIFVGKITIKYSEDKDIENGPYNDGVIYGQWTSDQNPLGGEIEDDSLYDSDGNKVIPITTLPPYQETSPIEKLRTLILPLHEKLYINIL